MVSGKKLNINLFNIYSLFILVSQLKIREKILFVEDFKKWK